MDAASCCSVALPDSCALAYEVEPLAEATARAIKRQAGVGRARRMPQITAPPRLRNNQGQYCDLDDKILAPKSCRASALNSINGDRN